LQRLVGFGRRHVRLGARNRYSRLPPSNRSMFIDRPLLYCQAAPVNGTSCPCESKRSPFCLLAPLLKLRSE
jgi:hypothetical protein